MEFLSSASPIIMIIFLVYIYVKGMFLNTERTSYFEDKKMNQLISDKKLDEFFKYTDSISSMKKSELKKVFTEKMADFYLSKSDIAGLMKIVNKCDISSYFKERILKDNINEKGLNLENAIKLIDSVIDNENSVAKVKAKEKVIEYANSI